MKHMILILPALVIFLASGSSRAETPDVNWLLKDAYEQEYLPLSSLLATMPEDLRLAMKHYDAGNFRASILVLDRLRKLNLPDGQLSFLAFALAENYRQLGCINLALDNYNSVITGFPESSEAPPSLFRIIETAEKNGETGKADTLADVFKSRFPGHPLTNSVMYVCALAHYRLRNYDRTVSYTEQISPQSSRSLQARFLSALCHLQVKDYQKALVILEPVRIAATDPVMAAEAAILIGDIYYMQNNLQAALKFYKVVPKKAKRFQYALVKTARIMLDLGNKKSAADLVRPFIRKQQAGHYYFEMASILEQAVGLKGADKAAIEENGVMNGELSGARLEFELYDEIERVTDLLGAWQGIHHEAVRLEDQALLRQANENMLRLQALEKKFYGLLDRAVGGGEVKKGRKVVPYQAERRYMGMLKSDIQRADDTLAHLNRNLDSAAALFRGDTGNQGAKKAVDSISARIEKVSQARNRVDREYQLVVHECINDNDKKRAADEEQQSEYVDWAFAKYADKKGVLKKILLQLAARSKASKRTADASQKPDSATAPATDTERKFTEADRDNQMRLIADDRSRLTSHIATVLDVYPQSRFNAQILFRLAELHYDAAGEDFQTRLKAYEKKMAAGSDTAGLEFPEYQLDSVIATYDRIIKEYPHGEITDGAYFYKALALQKLGNDAEANGILQALIKEFPESEYFVAANMNIGKFYFDHPKTDNGQGYKFAEEAYRRVLLYREHPEYVPALYHLGWCYYMQDRYNEAIAVFKYLIEETHLEFDPSKTDEKQVSNPLLRAEAIDYIAISFDAENKIEDAIQFLKLVGNIDYASLVLKRIGELREEDLDFGAAIRIYRRLIAEYPNSREAPSTFVALIRLYDTHDKPDSAMLVREEFFRRSTDGGKWREMVARGDSLQSRRLDSMAIMNGLSVADAAYRLADSTNDPSEYARAASNYERLVDSYPGDPHASEALWNLAVILDTKTQERPRAFDRYFAFSKLENMDQSRREQAALNAVAIAQALLPPDSLVQKGTLEFAAAKVVEAISNYTSSFASGASINKLTLALGGIYFNRRMFSEAAAEYQKVIDKGPQDNDYFEALSFFGQCKYGEEDWPSAIAAFRKIWKASGDSLRSQSAYKLLMQSEFLNAKKFLAAADFARAAEFFSAIDEKYPGSEYGDIVLFSSAEAYEKIQLWEKACDRYTDLVKRYPQSKLAPDALFNCAENYEKANKYARAAEAYEKLADEYPLSEQAKDALFNVAFCYEKLNQLDKMADANERYSARYPDEKDVEAILLRSAAYYTKSRMWDRAISVYRNYIRRYPRGSKTIEAYFMIAKCAYDQGDMPLALSGFSQTEQQNIAFSRDNLATNNFYAAEAAYYTGMIKREKYSAISLVLPEPKMKLLLKDKTDLLSETAKAFQRVIQYRSERMFEAAYRVGQLYEELSLSWQTQERPPLDPLKEAVLEKEIGMFSSSLLQKSIIPYEKALELAKGFDSLTLEQKQWVAKADSSLKHNFIAAGRLLSGAVNAMGKAPVPKEIQEKPLHFYQYQKQLAEALSPMNEQVRNYYLTVLNRCDSLALSGPLVDTCRSEFVHSNYLIGRGYDSLALQILKNSKDLARNLPPDEREDLVFQLEDIVFELQDKAIFAYEEALARVKSRNLLANSWARKILGSLARLSPEKYGSYFYERFVASSDNTWLVRTDSAGKWNAVAPPRSGWSSADTSLPVRAENFSHGNPRFIGGPIGTPHVFIWRNLFLTGTPRNAVAYIATPAMYNLYINGTLILSDTTGNRDLQKIDSATGIGGTGILKGGDNCIAVELRSTDQTHAGAAIVFSALIDTAEHFTSSVKLPDNVTASAEPVRRAEQNAGVPAMPANKGVRVTDKKKKSEPAQRSYVTQYRNHGELLKAIDDFGELESKLNLEARKERVVIQRAQIEKDSLDTRIKSVADEIDRLKAQISGMSRQK
ncbi:MAG: tetratricopeptide repeat protein [Chitinispirillaceae bacterium]|jgi:TolA-binding protein|nr:tetratricopeptide repeat protein [Chitinispirillaceae bacterium]